MNYVQLYLNLHLLKVGNMDLKNLSVRILSALILAPTTLYCIYMGSYYYLSLILVMTFFATKEMIFISSKKDSKPSSIISYLSAALIPYLFFKGDFELIFLGLLLIAVLHLIVNLFDFKDSAINASSNGYLNLIYVSVFISSSIYIRQFYSEIFSVDYINGAYFLMMIFASIWACDSFAYFGGVSFGKHKLYPKVSPKKSIEGSVCGFIATFGVLYG